MRLRPAAAAVAVATLVGVLVFGPVLNANATEASIAASTPVVSDSGDATPDFTPSKNKFKRFLINTTSKVLGKATPNKWKAEQIANDHQFNYSWEALEAQFGTKPSTGPYDGQPGTYDDYVIKKAELDGKGGKAGKLMNVPLTKAQKLTKTFTNASGAVTAVLVGSEVGFSVGKGVASAMGFNVDGGLCNPTFNDGGVIGAITGTDCADFFKMSPAYDKNGDVITGTHGLKSCATTGTLAGMCVQYVKTVESGGLQFAMYEFSGVTTQLAAHPSVTVCKYSDCRVEQVGQLAQVTSVYTYASSSTSEYQASACRSAWQQSGGASSLRRCPYGDGRSFWAYGEPAAIYLDSPGNLGATVTADPDPDRYLQCSITGSDGHTYTASSPDFKESSGKLAAPKCPELPTGVSPTGTVTVKECKRADATCATITTTDVNDAYTDWWTLYPECRTGECKLDLFSLTQKTYPVSCTDLEYACADWFKDPDKANKYECHYGIHTVDLDECNVYSGLFQPGRVDACSAYSDPLTGEWSGGKNSDCPDTSTIGTSTIDPTKIQACDDAKTWTLDIMFAAMSGAKCVMQWAFVPRPAVVATDVAGLQDKFSNKAPGQLTAMVSSWHFAPAMTGCKISTELFNVHFDAVNACSGPMAAVATASRVVTDVAFALMVYLIVKRQVGGMVDYR